MGPPWWTNVILLALESSGMNENGEKRTSMWNWNPVFAYCRIIGLIGGPLWQRLTNTCYKPGGSCTKRWLTLIMLDHSQISTNGLLPTVVTTAMKLASNVFTLIKLSSQRNLSTTETGSKARLENLLTLHNGHILCNRKTEVTKLYLQLSEMSRNLLLVRVIQYEKMQFRSLLRVTYRFW